MRYGYTLLEVLAVLLILSLAVQSIMLFSGPSDRLQLDVTCQEIAAILVKARSTAMTNGVETVVKFDLKEHVLLSNDSNPVKFPDEIEIRLTFAREEVDQKMRGAIRFFSDGTSTGGEIKAQLRKISSIITINWLTGQVLIRDI